MRRSTDPRRRARSDAPHHGASVVRAAGGGCDQFPEFGVLLEGFVFADGQAGAEEEVFEAVLAQDAVDDDAEFVALEIDAVIPEAEAVQELVVAFEPTEAFEVGAHHFLGEAAKLAEDLQLEFLGHLREFGGAGGVEDDLEGAHGSVDSFSQSVRPHPSPLPRGEGEELQCWWRIRESNPSFGLERAMS